MVLAAATPQQRRVERDHCRADNDRQRDLRICPRSG
jgi:hypothetical protein